MLHNGDCLDVMRGMADNSVDLVLTDPPYFKVKPDAWDRQWDKPAEFLSWLGEVVDECARVMKPNGSLFLFASPEMSARVECMIAERLNVLNCIRWDKTRSKNGSIHRRGCKEIYRSFFPARESIIFAEHYGADNIAKGEAGYGAKRDELRGFVFEPLRAYLDSERKRAGFTTRKVAEAFQKKSGSRTVTGMAGHWFTNVQWTLPTEENYNWLRQLFNSSEGSGFLEYLRREYEDLRREYEDLRRPFAVSADVPYTDTWTFDTVKPYAGKHPCEKPLDMLRHMIGTASRPGAVVLDPFMGSGTTGMACKETGREFIGIELDAEYYRIAEQRIEHHAQQTEIPS
jgi:site-specific DNA-methyltransferase (adenine-specific)